MVIFINNAILLFSMITVLVPVYNEEEVIQDFLDDFEKAVSTIGQCELLLINDGSTDKTREIIEFAEKNYSYIRVIHHDTNKGLGAALATGFKNAKGEYIVTLDSDLTHSPHFIATLLHEKKEYDCCIASRYVTGGGMKNVPGYRILISRFANFMFGVMYQIPVKDITSGFKVYNTNLLKNIEFSSQSYSLQLEIMVILAKKKASFIEIPFVLTNREKGTSKFHLSVVPKYFTHGMWLLGYRWLK